jgi:hypothetical protein
MITAAEARLRTMTSGSEWRTYEVEKTIDDLNQAIREMSIHKTYMDFWCPKDLTYVIATYLRHLGYTVEYNPIDKTCLFNTRIAIKW